MISHDPNTRRCFGLDHNVTTTNYIGVLEKLYSGKGAVPADVKKALAIPKETGNDEYKMPTFKEVVQLFANDERYKNVRLMVDIKVTNEPWIIPKLFQTLKDANPDVKGFWASKVVFGMWRLDVLESALRNTTDIPLAYIGVSRGLAKQFIDKGGDRLKAVSLNRFSLMSIGSKYIMDYATEKGVLIYMWTTNAVNEMQWAVASDLAGIITDHPDCYNDLRSQMDARAEKEQGTDDSETTALIKSSVDNPAKYVNWFDWYFKYPVLYLIGKTLFSMLLKKSQDPKNQRPNVDL